MDTAAGPREAPARVLVVVAHPDDIDFGTAGTVAQLTKAGSHVAYCLVTSGESGEDDMTVPTLLLADMREAEQTAAASEVGVTELYFLHHSDGLVENGPELRRDIARIIRIEKPDVVITQNPRRNFDSTYGSHPDHLETGEATIRAVYPDARNPRAFCAELLEQGYEPHAVGEVWIHSTEPDLFVDITDVFDMKLRALRSHTSQVAKRDEEFDLEKLLGEWGGGLAKQGEMPEGRIAEAFRVLDTR
ncbi:MAG: PIG-L family deacetylase [Acidimicrobiales bacterium]|nr:PIG-L family deacetylase [Acidimicrobiales bacterium]RZV46423.1 MAG: PIG-L family deacetylase [Acidimicrobiales bacterium]